MDESQRLNLKKMLRNNDAPETTEHIRKLKHSKKIKEDINRMEILKKKYQRLSKSNASQYRQIITNQCSFLFNNYTNIFNRLLKNQLDLNILNKFISVLHHIEEGDIDQHEGSFEVGKLLKELYLDSVVRQDKMSDKGKKMKQKKPVKNISWAEFKKIDSVNTLI
jgi:hypothetical protein